MYNVPLSGSQVSRGGLSPALGIAHSDGIAGHRLKGETSLAETSQLCEGLLGEKGRVGEAGWE